jgi:hypothetical protein
MKQYCRYCSHLCTGNGIWCDAKQKILSESTTKSVNHCKDFDFCEIDAYFETDGYKERSERRTIPKVDEVSENQLLMEV